ncbi:MAG: alpha/beta hydrolase [Bdellovibrionales bacterium]
MTDKDSFLKNFKYELQGSADMPKIVFLHGVMGSGANWRKITPAFKNDYQVLTFDQRGHGWSFKPKEGYAPADYANDLMKILDELKWDKIILVGHSMGGRNALHFANRYPERVRALVVEDIGPQGNPKAMQKTIDMVEMVPTPFASKKHAKDYFSGAFIEELISTSGDVKGVSTGLVVAKMSYEQARVLGQYFYTNIEVRTDGLADWRFSKNAILASLIKGHFEPNWEIVRTLNVPTLFVRGEWSEDFPKTEYEKLLTINPMVSGVEVAQSGHWIHYDQAEKFIQVLKEFLEKL